MASCRASSEHSLSLKTLQANKSGDMTVKVETDTAQVATYFTGLQEGSTAGGVTRFAVGPGERLRRLDETRNQRTQWAMPTSQESNLSTSSSLDTAEVRLDIKKFAQLLHSQQPHAEKMVFSKFILFRSLVDRFSFADFSNNSMLHICIVAEYFTLQCIIPSIQL